MQKYSVTGMSCAACQARVEKAVSKVPGVTQCSVSLLTNSMGVEGSATPDAIISAVIDAGYGATLAGEAVNPLEDKESPILKKRLIFSVGFLLVLMYISMGHMMWNFPLPPPIATNHMCQGLLQMILAATVMFINRKFFISGTRGLLHAAPNMDTLVALGSGVSFAYSAVVLFTSHNMHNLYFESAAMIVTLITIGKLLESLSKGKTTNALKSLMKLAPQTAVVLQDDKEVTLPIDQVKIGDIFVVRPGESIPVDGIVIEGSSAVNESALTGESIPVEKLPKSTVSAATINTSGFLKCQATRVGQDTTLSQIIKMVSDAAATKAPIAKIADKVSGIFVPTVIGIALVSTIIWLLCGADFSFALSRGIAVLVVSCPCALGLATPVAIMVGNGIGAKNGILFKTSAALEVAGKTQIIALDKTGTITKGQMEVVSVISDDETALLSKAAGLEAKSEHPLARAVVKYAQNRGISPAAVTNFEAVGGKGVKARIDENTWIFGGNATFIKENCPILSCDVEEIAKRGQTPLIFAEKERLLGIIAIADVIKDEAPEAIRQLKNMGIHVVMLTGDNPVTAAAIAKQAGVDEVIAGVLPDGKEQVVRDLQKRGVVAMVGDGINDAPALTRADVGIAIGAGTDVAIDAADVVLVKSHLDDIPAAIRLSRRTLKNIRENLFWAFFYNVILIPVAAGAYYHLWGLQMSPMLGAAAMSLSSVSVVSNALRLNLIKIRNSKNDKKIKQSANKESNMEKTIKVEGMMCEHCEARVKAALEGIKGVTEATPDHKSGEVKMALSKEVKDSAFEKAITKAGYKFLG